jgi:hypothetical protein
MSFIFESKDGLKPIEGENPELKKCAHRPTSIALFDNKNSLKLINRILVHFI